MKYRLNDGSYCDYETLDQLFYALRYKIAIKRDNGDNVVSISLHSWKGRD